MPQIQWDGLTTAGVITAFFAGVALVVRAVRENIALSKQTHAQGKEIKDLVNGTNSKLLEDLKAAKQALDTMHAENRALHALLTRLLPLQEPPAVSPVPPVPIAAASSVAASLRAIEGHTADTARNTEKKR